MPNEKSKKTYRTFSEHARVTLGPERYAAAKSRADGEIKVLQLAQLREKLRLTQTDIKGFRQADVSKIENRSDMKLSTFLRYLLEGLEVEVEITARFKSSGASGKLEEIVLLKETPAKRRRAQR